MSRISGKLNIIDQNTYQNLKHEHGDRVPRVLRSSKYKNKHKKEQQCSLFDFLTVPRKKQKHTNRKKRPHLLIARNSITFQPKRKGKTRLHPKHRVTRLKRIIRRFRQLKLRSAEDKNGLEPLDQTCECTLQDPPSKLLSTKIEKSLSVQASELKEAQAGNPLPIPAHHIHSRRFRR